MKRAAAPGPVRRRAETPAAARARGSRGCDRWVALGIVVVVVAGVLAAYLAGAAR
jgi:hypothetical protein